MSEAGRTPNQKLITELKVSGHLMTLDPGVFVVFHAPGGAAPDPVMGLPGVRISPAPGPSGEGLTISAFRPDGWLGGQDGAALIRVVRGGAQVLVTVYQLADSRVEAPRLQVLRLSDGAGGALVPAQAPAQPQQPQAAAQPAQTVSQEDAEIVAHIQGRGDVLDRLSDWIGERGSKRWIEGFSVAPKSGEVGSEDIEYQAVLGRGWLSPWSEGGQFCGSRGMGLPILGLRVRLRGEAAATHECVVSASFVDGTEVGPRDDSEPCQADSLAPLEAFRIELRPRAAADEAEPQASPSSSGKKSGKGRR
jgi:Clostridial hydrophobic W